MSMTKSLREHRKLSDAKAKRTNIMLQIDGDYHCHGKCAVTKSDHKNVMFIGRTRTGKSTIKKLLFDPRTVPDELTLKTGTRQSLFESFHSIDNNMVLNIIDTPGLFQRGTAQIGIQDNEVILRAISMCINMEITRFHVICFCMALTNGINTEDIESLKLLISFLGDNLTNNSCLIITHCESKTKEQRDAYKNELVQDPSFNSIASFFKLGIFFSGSLNRDDYNHGNESLLDQFVTICEYREQLIELFTSEIEPFPISELLMNQMTNTNEDTIKKQLNMANEKNKEQKSIIAQLTNTGFEEQAQIDEATAETTELVAATDTTELVAAVDTTQATQETTVMPVTKSLREQRKLRDAIAKRTNIMSQIKTDYHCHCKYRVTKANHKNVMFIGRTRTGKSTIKKLLFDPRTVSDELTLKTATRQPLFESFHSKENNIVLNIIDTPGLFQRGTAEIGIQDNEVILRIISMCINMEITRFHVICFCMALTNGINTEDIQSLKLLINFLGPDLTNNSCLIITHCESKTKEQRDAYKNELVQDPSFNSIASFFKLGIFFSGSLNRDDYNHGNESLLDQFVTICEYREQLIKLFTSEIQPFPISKMLINQMTNSNVPTDPVPTDSVSTHSIPADSVPTDPVPTNPVPTDALPKDPVPTDPVPADPVPTNPVPTDALPKDPVPTDPVPADPVTTDPVPTNPIQTDPLPKDPIPTDPAPIESIPTDPVSTNPVPTDALPTDSVPTDPVPTDPVTTDPVPTNPVQTDPLPKDPAPTDTVPIDPVPTNLVPTDPVPTEPVTT